MLQAHYLKIQDGALREPTDICGVKSYPLLDFIEIEDYIFPVLHGEIGLANLALDHFLDFVDDKEEVLSEEGKVARNYLVIAEVASSNYKEVQEFECNRAMNVTFFMLSLLISTIKLFEELQ